MTDPSMSALHGLIRRATGRLRVQFVLNDVTTSVWIGLFFASLGLALHKAEALDAVGLWFALCAAAPLLGAVYAMLRRIDPVTVAVRLDEAHGFKDRLASALQFEKLPSQSPFVKAHIQDTMGRISAIDYKKIHTFVAPPDLAALPIFAASLLILSLVSFPTPPPPQAPQAAVQTIHTPDTVLQDPPKPTIVNTIVSDNARALYKDEIEKIIEDIKDSDDPELKDAAEELKKLLAADDQGSISGEEFEAKLTTLQEKMATPKGRCNGVDPGPFLAEIAPLSPLFGDNEDTQKIQSLIASDQNGLASNAFDALAKRAIKSKKTNGYTEDAFWSAVNRAKSTHLFCQPQETAIVDQQLRDAADIFKDNPITQPVAKALENGDLDEAAKALEKIAQQVAEKQFKEQDLEALASLLEKFSDFIDPNDPDIKKLIEKHRSSLKNLQSKMKKSGGKLNAADQKKLDEANRELQRLTQPQNKNPGPGAQQDLQDLTQQARQAADMLRNQNKPQTDPAAPPKPSTDPTAEPKPSTDPAAQPKPSTDPTAQPKPSTDPSSAQENAPKDPQGKPQDPPHDPQKPDNLADKLRDIDKQKNDQKAQDQMRDLSERLREEAKRSKGESRPSDQQAQSDQMKDFMDRAKGKKPGEDKGEGDQGKNPPKPGDNGQKAGAGKQDSSETPSDAQKTQGTSKPGAQKDGERDPSAQTQDTQKGGQGSAERSNNNGQKPGSADDNANFKPNTEDVYIGGVDGGQGPTEPTSDVIKDASQSGFASTAYKDVHAEYTTYAEEAMDREKVPPGYRRYIHLYFDFIGPQEYTKPSAP